MAENVKRVLSQILIVHMIRIRKIPFIQSYASRSVLILTVMIMTSGIFIPFTILGKAVNLKPLSGSYFSILFCYCVLTQVVKK